MYLKISDSTFYGSWEHEELNEMILRICFKTGWKPKDEIRGSVKSP